MKAIINGKRFDTEKAILIGSHSSKHKLTKYDDDEKSEGAIAYNWEASLYRTPQSNRFFLAGEGVAYSSLGLTRSTGGERERIVPITKREAFMWAENFLTQDEIESGFADLIEEA